MAKSTGLGDRLAVDGADLSGDVGSLSRIGGGLAGTQDVTGINRSAFERIGLLRDGSMDLTAFFNPSRAHPQLSTLPTADRVVTYMRGAARGNRAASLTAKQINYDPTRNADGSLTIAVQAQANGFGLEWGRQLTAGPEALSAAGALAGVDYGAAVGTTVFGLQAYLHVLAFTGTSIDVAVQHSDDDGALDPYADVVGAVFTTATGTGAERVQTARDASVKRWLRVNVGGTFTAATIAVVAVRNLTAVVF